MNIPALAQLKSPTKMVIFDGAYAYVGSDETGHMIDGYSISAAFEKRHMIGLWSGGISLMYLKFQDKNNKSQREIKYSSVPVTLYGKLLFGPSNFSGYFLGGVGVHFSSVSHRGNDYYESQSNSGFLLIMGLGVHVFLNEKIFLNIAYNHMFLDNSAYRSDMLALLKLGIGFQYD